MYGSLYEYYQSIVRGCRKGRLKDLHRTGQTSSDLVNYYTKEGRRQDVTTTIILLHKTNVCSQF